MRGRGGGARGGGVAGTRDRSSDRKLHVDPRCIRCCNWTPRTPLNQLSPAKRARITYGCANTRRFDKRCTRVGGDIAAQLTSYSPSGAYDIRLDFGKLSPRITRERAWGSRVVVCSGHQLGISWDCCAECNLRMQPDAYCWYVTIFGWHAARRITQFWIATLVSSSTLLRASYFKIVFTLKLES